MQVFISYSHRDQARVALARDGLRDAGVRTWMDLHDLLDPDEYDRKIGDAMVASDVIVVFVSADLLGAGQGYLFRECTTLLRERGVERRTIMVHLDGLTVGLAHIGEATVPWKPDEPAGVVATRIVEQIAAGPIPARLPRSAASLPVVSAAPRGSLAWWRLPRGVVGRWYGPTTVVHAQVKADLLGRRVVTWEGAWRGEPSVEQVSTAIQKEHPYAVSGDGERVAFLVMAAADARLRSDVENGWDVEGHPLFDVAVSQLFLDAAWRSADGEGRARLEGAFKATLRRHGELLLALLRTGRPQQEIQTLEDGQGRTLATLVRVRFGCGGLAGIVEASAAFESFLGSSEFTIPTFGVAAAFLEVEPDWEMRREPVVHGLTVWVPLQAIRSGTDVIARALRAPRGPRPMTGVAERTLRVR